MGKIQNDHQLQVSRKAIERLQRALKGYEAANIGADGLQSLRIGIRQIEREIEVYLTEKTAETPEQTPLKAASG